MGIALLLIDDESALGLPDALVECGFEVRRDDEVARGWYGDRQEYRSFVCGRGEYTTALAIFRDRAEDKFLSIVYGNAWSWWPPARRRRHAASSAARHPPSRRRAARSRKSRRLVPELRSLWSNGRRQ